MTTIKAIETRYGGHLFRSRLEARWAMFFDLAGIPWQYELEAYELPRCINPETGADIPRWRGTCRTSTSRPATPGWR